MLATPDDILVRGDAVHIQNSFKYLYLLGEMEYFELNRHTKEQYDELIKTFDYKNYNNNPDDWIIVTHAPENRWNKKWILLDGDHRLSILVYHNIIPFQVKVIDQYKFR